MKGIRKRSVVVAVVVVDLFSTMKIHKKANANNNNNNK